MKKILCLAIFSVLLGTGIYAQIADNQSYMKPIRNSVYLELMGNGGLFSVNYDRAVFIKDKMRVFVRAGLSEWHSDDTDALDIAVIGETGMLFGGPKHFLDLRLGLTYWTKDSEKFIVPRMGYRYIG